MNQYHTGYLAGQISPVGEAFGINVIAAMREAVGPSVGILLDAHGHYLQVPRAAGAHESPRAEPVMMLSHPEVDAVLGCSRACALAIGFSRARQ